MNKHCPLQDISACQHPEPHGLCQACQFDFETLDPDEGMYKLRRANGEGVFARHQIQAQKAKDKEARLEEARKKQMPEEQKAKDGNAARIAELEAQLEKTKEEANRLSKLTQPQTPAVSPKYFLAGKVIGVAVFVLLLWLAFKPSQNAAGPGPGVMSSPTSGAAGQSVSPPFKPGSILRDCEGCPTLTVVAAGAFNMGSNGESASGSESPLRNVQIARAFALGKYEVSFKQWAQCVAEAGCRRANGNGFGEDLGGGLYMPADESHPVQGVSVVDITEYLQWLSTKTGKKYRLPSASEWEYSARAGTTGDFWWGNDTENICKYENVRDLAAMQFNGASRANTGEVANCSDGFAGSAPVSSGEANPWGFHNMLGNVAEVVADCGTAEPNEVPVNGAPFAGMTDKNRNCQWRTLKGGGFIGSFSPQRYAAWKQRMFTANESCQTGYGEKWLCGKNGIGFRVTREL